MAIHTCPRCELRFSYRAEMCDHLFNDHRVGHLTTDGIENLVLAGSPRRHVPNPLGGGVVS